LKTGEIFNKSDNIFLVHEKAIIRIGRSRSGWIRLLLVLRDPYPDIVEMLDPDPYNMYGSTALPGISALKVLIFLGFLRRLG